MKVRRTRTLSSSRPSVISALFGGGKRHGAKIVARFMLVIKFSVHLTASMRMKAKKNQNKTKQKKTHDNSKTTICNVPFLKAVKRETLFVYMRFFPNLWETLERKLNR